MAKRRGARKRRAPPSAKKASAASAPIKQRIVKESTSFSYRGKKRKSYRHKLTDSQIEYMLDEAAVRDFIKSERGKGRRLTYASAQRDPEFIKAMQALKKLGESKRRSLKTKQEATNALKTLGRISKYAKGIYF